MTVNPHCVYHYTYDEQVIPGRRLGRHVEHDERSLAYLVADADPPAVTTVWPRRVPVFDQGELGSCTGNACAGVLGTDPYYATLPAGLVDNEAEAVRLYSAAEKIDGGAGYPPEDQGSSGLSVAKAAKAAGLISGYLHVTSLAAAHTAIKTGPFLVGTDWHEGMDSPDAAGVVTDSGAVRGGHEYECVGYHADTDLWEFVNSWGPSWGVAGHFFYSSATFTALLAEDGDATVLVPVDQPAPTPAPVPVPVPPSPGAGTLTWTAATPDDARTVQAFAVAPTGARAGKTKTALRRGTWRQGDQS